MEYEEILQATGSSGAIFALKNFGWQDKTEVEINERLTQTRDKIKGFLDDDSTDDGSSEPITSNQPEARDEVAEAPTDIS
jgi:hypothetical protein